MTIKATVVCLVLAVSMGAAQALPPKPTAKPTGVAATPKFKAIWEPVPFSKDIDLSGIACVGPEACWAVGDKSTILATTDGGTTWQVQLGGDPASTDDDLVRVRFLDATHGWAMTGGGKLLGTSDGSTWAELSTLSGTSRGVWFLSPQIGLEFNNRDSTSQSTQQRSSNGGKTWRPEGRCSVDATLDGLARKLECLMTAAHFVSPTVGFSGGGAEIAMATRVATFAKTTNGGQGWTTSVIPETKYEITAVTFWTEKDGIVVLAGGEEVYWTADAGATWTRSTKQRQWPGFFGVGEGKIIVGIAESGGAGYSFNGGRTFTSRPLVLPARTRALTFPDAQHGYLVGEHAMVYRYRIVPVAYTRQGMLAAMAP